MKVYKTDKCGKGHTFSQEDLECDTLKHKLAVQDACDLIAAKLIAQAQNHDHTKLGSDEDEFYKALSSGSVKISDWWIKHTREERHHLNDHAPDDVNMIDVIEMICDCVCAGEARTGKVKPIEIPDDVLQKAVKNTADMLIKEIEISQ